MKRSSLKALVRLGKELARKEQVKASYEAYQQSSIATPTAEEIDSLWEDRKKENKSPTSTNGDRAILERNGLS